MAFDTHYMKKLITEGIPLGFKNKKTGQKKPINFTFSNSPNITGGQLSGGSITADKLNDPWELPEPFFHDPQILERSDDDGFVPCPLTTKFNNFGNYSSVPLSQFKRHIMQVVLILEEMGLKKVPYIVNRSALVIFFSSMEDHAEFKSRYTAPEKSSSDDMSLWRTWSSLFEIASEGISLNATYTIPKEFRFVDQAGHPSKEAIDLWKFIQKLDGKVFFHDNQAIFENLKDKMITASYVNSTISALTVTPNLSTVRLNINQHNHKILYVYQSV